METIYFNGKIHTLQNNQVVEAMYVKDGLIQEIGSNNELFKLFPNASREDLKGNTVIPGFTDSHIHIIQDDFIECSSATSVDNLVNMMQDGIPSNISGDEWIIGRGWNHDYFDEVILPTRYDLDRVSTDNPVCVIRACGHIAIINSKALELLNITKDNIPIISGGEIVIDKENEPTGLFTEFALDYIYQSFDKPSNDKIKNIIIRECNKLASQGITTAHTDDFKAFLNVDFEDIIKAYEELSNTGRLPIRIYQQCLLPELETLENFINKGYKTGYGNDYYRIGPLKLLLDGSLGARTAWLSKPYNDDPSTSGLNTYNLEAFHNIVKYAHINDMQIAVHGIGDMAIKTIIDELINVQLTNPLTDRRHGIVHAQITETNDIIKMANHQIQAYVQPIFLHYDTQIVESRVGKELANTSYNFKTMKDLGINVSFGTDSPVELPNPFHNLYCAITRKNLNNNMEHGWLENEAFTLDEALEAYSVSGAYASYQENIKGRLLPGMFADFMILEENIYTINIEDLKDVLPIKTIVGGKIVFEK